MDETMPSISNRVYRSLSVIFGGKHQLLLGVIRQKVMCPVFHFVSSLMVLFSTVISSSFSTFQMRACP